ncbi:Dabb family protein [Thiomonas intermedia]|uniref:Dabb family protein n=1 Tax=Thiomonas intermedia TaxID=926 RepID=UPI001FE4C8F2|nr:Dabb family protein [Thiomonas intermedia]
MLLRFRPEVEPARAAALLRDFAALATSISGVAGVESGENISPEGLDKGFTHAVLLQFVDAGDRDLYLSHPAHQAFARRLQDAAAEVLVVDFLDASAPFAA